MKVANFERLRFIINDICDSPKNKFRVTEADDDGNKAVVFYSEHCFVLAIFDKNNEMTTAFAETPLYDELILWREKWSLIETAILEKGVL